MILVIYKFFVIIVIKKRNIILIFVLNEILVIKVNWYL